MTRNRTYQQPPTDYRPRVCRNNLVTTEEKEKCRFEMFALYKPGIPRKYPPKDIWTHRGDHFPDTPPERYLGRLLQRFFDELHMLDQAIIRDNTKLFEHPHHELLVYKEGLINVNHLELLDPMLKYMYKKIPVWLEWEAVKEWRKSI